MTLVSSSNIAVAQQDHSGAKPMSLECTVDPAGPSSRAQDQSSLMLARLLWHPDAQVQPSSQLRDGLGDLIKQWLCSHRVAGHLEADVQGYWLHAPLEEKDLFALQNDIHNALGVDIFIAFLKQNPTTNESAPLACWRSDIDQAARAAALALHTHPVACLHPMRAKAIAVFRQHAGEKSIDFELQPIWHSPPTAR